MKERRDVEVIDKGDYKIYKFHGSVLGDCVHRQVLSLLNPEDTPPPFSDFVQSKYFQKGHDAEAWAKQQFLDAGWEVRGASNKFEEQISVSIWGSVNTAGYGERDRILLSAHLDGEINRARSDASERYRLEVKCPGDVAFAEIRANHWQNKSPYAYQTSIAQWGNERGQKGDYRETPFPLMAVILRRDAYNDDTIPKEDRICRWTQAEPDYTAEQCLDRARYVLHCAKTGFVPECDSVFKPCQWGKWEKEAATVHIQRDHPEYGVIATGIECLAFNQAGLATLEAVISQQKKDIASNVKKILGQDVGKVHLVGTANVSLAKNGRLFISESKEEETTL